MKEYLIDIEKAVKAPHAEYFFRLLLALNDLSSAHQARHYLSSCADMPDRVSKGITGYLCRVQIAHLVEAYIAFVEKVPTRTKPGSNESVATFLRKHPKLGPLFADLESVLKESGFKDIKNLRNTFVFHYNYKEHGQDTMNAVNAILSSKQHNARNSGLMVYDGQSLTDRFVIADNIANAGWKMLSGLPEDLDFESDPLAMEHRVFEEGVSCIYQIWILRHSGMD